MSNTRFKVIPIDEFIAQHDGVSFAQVKEERAAGFREGYGHAKRMLDQLINAGYKRPTEISNILWDHEQLVTRWQAYEPHPVLDIVAWAELREQVFERDGRICELCSATDDLHIDHITEVKRGGLPLLSNLRVLCRGCNLARNGETAA